MAKQSLPSVELDAAKVQQRVSVIERDIEATTGGDIVTTEAATYAGYVSRRVDVTLTRAAAIKLRDKTRQLQDSGAKTADGRYVTNRTQAVQWIMENEVNI